MNMNTNIKRLLYIGTFFCCLYIIAIFINIWIYFPIMKDVLAGFLLGALVFIFKPFFNNKKEKKDGDE